METECKVKNDWLVVSMPREVDHHHVKDLRVEMENYIKTEKIRHLVLDFSRTVFMDSSGIGMIMGRYRQMTAVAGDVTAIHVSDPMKRILQLSGVHKFIRISQKKVWNIKAE